MPDGTSLTPPVANRLPAPPEVWEAVREDYMAGITAEECCRRHGVGLSTLRDRAARGKWRRTDVGWIPSNALDAQDEGVELEEKVHGDLDRIELRELSFVAYRRMMRCVLRGDAAGALRWRRVRLAMDLEEEEVQRFFEQEEYLLFQRADRPDGSDGSDGSDANFRPDR